LAALWLRVVVIYLLYGYGLSSRYRGIPLHERYRQGAPACARPAMAAMR